MRLIRCNACGKEAHEAGPTAGWWELEPLGRMRLMDGNPLAQSSADTAYHFCGNACLAAKAADAAAYEQRQRAAPVRATA